MRCAKSASRIDSQVTEGVCRERNFPNDMRFGSELRPVSSVISNDHLGALRVAKERETDKGEG